MQYSKCNFNRLAPPQVRGDKTSPILLLQRALFQYTRYSIVVAVVTLQHFDICNLLTGQYNDMLQAEMPTIDPFKISLQIFTSREAAGHGLV